MERFWDARAREDAFWFVDSRLEYGAADEERFWAGGVEALDGLLAALGASLSPDQVVVDIGCGLGRLTRPLARRAARVIAIDVSSEMLARARQLNPDLGNVEWVHGDGQTLRPIADGSVDACISHVVFRHIPDPAVTLGYVREMGRVLRPGGFAGFEVSNDPELHRPATRGARGRAAAALRRAPRGISDDAWLGAHLDLEEMERAATDAGLAVERIVGEGTSFCAVLLRRRGAAPPSPNGTGTGLVARYYDEFWSGEIERHYEPDPKLLALILEGVTGATHCLDVGCGSCNSYAPELARRAASLVGVDISANAIAEARAAGFDARVVRDAAELPFADESFDHVVCVEVLEHLFLPHRAIEEIRRVLRPGGRVVVSTPNLAYWRLRANALFGFWNPLGDELAAEQPWRDPHIRFFTMKTLERMLGMCGVAPIEIGAHGGRGIDHMTSRRTGLGQGRVYRLAERRLPSLLGLTIHAVAVK
jgi:SAM-dependent methyltransferase